MFQSPDHRLDARQHTPGVFVVDRHQHRDRGQFQVAAPWFRGSRRGGIGVLNHTSGPDHREHERQRDPTEQQHERRDRQRLEHVDASVVADQIDVNPRGRQCREDRNRRRQHHDATGTITDRSTPRRRIRVGRRTGRGDGPGPHRRRRQAISGVPDRRPTHHDQLKKHSRVAGIASAIGVCRTGRAARGMGVSVIRSAASDNTCRSRRSDVNSARPPSRAFSIIFPAHCRAGAASQPAAMK